MKIYLAHSSSFDFQTGLYAPIKSSALALEHDFIFPHAGNSISDSRKIIAECDMVLAETSYPSTGLGIELGWASALGKKIIAFYKSGLVPSSSIHIITTDIYEYSQENLIETLNSSLQETS